MGEPVKIMDLAHDLIRLSGLEEGLDVDNAPADRIEELIRSALNNPDDWDALRLQLRALVPDFHIPPPPPPTEELEQHAAGEARKLHLA